MFSNRYIYIFSIVMAISVAAILAFVSTSLSDKQAENVKIEKIQMILNSIHIENSTDNAVELYQKHILKEITVNTQGEIVSEYENRKFKQGKKRAFNINLKEALYELEKENKTELPVFIFTKENKNYYVVPLLGKGLWGPIWGYLSFNEDLETIYGAILDHKSETPGLGAEIANYDIFQKQFEGKKIYDINDNLVGITVVKGGVESSNIPLENGVDAISGGTITSNGVTNMIQSNLKNYEVFFNQLKK